jgi:imidazolonepropionase-like amidohydrolase
MDAIVAATSLNAESLGLQNRIGAVAPGLEADLIAVDGDLSVAGHHCFAARRLRDEGRQGLPEHGREP